MLPGPGFKGASGFDSSGVEVSCEAGCGAIQGFFKGGVFVSWPLIWSPQGLCHNQLAHHGLSTRYPYHQALDFISVKFSARGIATSSHVSHPSRKAESMHSGDDTLGDANVLPTSQRESGRVGQCKTSQRCKAKPRQPRQAPTGKPHTRTRSLRWQSSSLIARGSTPSQKPGSSSTSSSSARSQSQG